MTSHSKRQLKTPRMARNVFLVTASASAVGGEDGCRQAFDVAAAAVDLPAETLARYVHSCCYVPPPGEASGSLHARLGLAPLGSVDAARGGPALWIGASAVAGGCSDAVLIAAWDEHGAHCVVLADRETAETLTTTPVRLGVAIAHGASSGLDGVDLARRYALSLAGVESASLVDDLPAGHLRIVQFRTQALAGAPSMLVLQGHDDRVTVVVLAI